MKGKLLIIGIIFIATSFASICDDCVTVVQMGEVWVQKNYTQAEIEQEFHEFCAESPNLEQIVISTNTSHDMN
jgi:hypothetical protein